MPNVTQWQALIDADMPWRQRYGEIARVVKHELDTWALNDPTTECSSKQLVEYLMPIASCRGEQITARNELFHILGKLAKYDLKDYCHKSDNASKAFGQKVYPWIWHANRKPVATCPHCGGLVTVT